MKLFRLSSAVFALVGTAPLVIAPVGSPAVAVSAPAPERSVSQTADRASARSAVVGVLDASLPTAVVLPSATTIVPPTTAPAATVAPKKPVTTTTPRRTPAAAAVATPSRRAATVASTPAAAPSPAPAPAPVETAPKAAPPAGDANVRAAAIVRAQVGKAYVRGATGPNAFDCSGLVFYAFNQAGKPVPRLTDAGYYARSTKITRAQLQPGDLIKFSGHMGIYVGGGMMVHASTPRGGVKLAPIDAPGRPTGYGRL